MRRRSAISSRSTNGLCAGRVCMSGATSTPDCGRSPLQSKRRSGRRSVPMAETLVGGDGAATALEPNPLREGLASDRIKDPCSIVFFGASGDLMKRMLLPALYNLRLEDVLPSNFAIVGYSRTKWSDDDFRGQMKKAVEEFSRSGPPREPLWSD